MMHRPSEQQQSDSLKGRVGLKVRFRVRVRVIVAFSSNFPTHVGSCPKRVVVLIK